MPLTNRIMPSINRIMLLIRRAFAQGVSDHKKCDFDIGPFHFFDLLFETFAIEANASSQFRAVIRNQSHGHELEQHLELELLLLVREVRWRGGVSESHRTGWKFVIFKYWGSLFCWRRFSGRFFLKDGAKLNPKWHQTYEKI